MAIVKQIAKLFIANFLYYSGVLMLLTRTRMQNRGFVLTYHRIVKAGDEAKHHSAPGIVVRERTFDQNLSLITRFFRPIDLDNFQKCLENSVALPSRSCLITFDDGWLDNYQIAGPLLKARGLSACIFLPCDYLSTDRSFWQEDLLQILITLRDSPNHTRWASTAKRLSLVPTASRAIIREYITSLKSKKQEEIDEVMKFLKTQYVHIAGANHHDRFMTWEHVSELEKQGICFGSHSMSHRLLTKLNSEAVREELAKSKKVLEGRLSRGVSSLAYPSGESDARIERIARETGYQLAFSTKSGFVAPSTNRWSIPRINVHEGFASSRALFLCTILGIF